MAEAISDAALVTVLRPFVRGTRPVLNGLREVDPFGLRTRVVSNGERGFATKVADALSTVEVPGTAAWAGMDVTARSRWWVRRVGRLTTALAAVPGIGGALANRLPVATILGAAGQGLVLVAIAGEHGVHDENELVALLGAVLFRRELTPDVLRPAVDGVPAGADTVAVETAALTEDPDGPSPVVVRFGRAVWRLGRALVAAEGELDRRPHGNIVHRGLSLLPVVGVAGRYLGEWSGLKRAAREAEHRLQGGGGTRYR